ncbi:MAG TPA: FAD-dependent oxidoreductase, partial [Methanosarcinales archaeon]|nr:FAD-dependent oxidoreductase [Methanosarcinales archaeon]
MKTIIIGGGLSGLASAYRMLKEDISDVTILEKGSEVGGMAASYHIDNYHIEKYYHHIFASDSELIDLIGSMGLGADLQWLKGTTGYYIDGKIHPMNTPIELLKSPLSVPDLIRIAYTVLVTRRAKDEEIYKLDRVTAKEWILKNAGRSVYERFFEPLLRSKFGSSHDRVSAAWLFGRIRIRSNRSTSGEKLGYLRGGFHRLVARLTESIVAMGGEIRTNCEASEIRTVDGNVSGVDAGGYIDCDSVISTVSPHALLKIISDAPDIPYQ